MKRMNSTLFVFKVWKPENFIKLLAKEEKEEVEEDVQRDSKVIKEYVEKLFLKVVSVQKFYEMQVKVLLL